MLPSVRFLHIIIGLLLICRPAFGADGERGDISITFDVTAARAVLSLFNSSDPTKGEVTRLLSHPAIQATISQTERFSDGANADAYVDSLWAVLRGQEPEHDPFNFQGVRDRLTGIESAISSIAAKGDTISTNVGERLASYTPSHLSLETTLYAVVGGTSDGWAPGDGNFYVALQYFREDVPGLTCMVTHEMYHVAQPAFFSDRTDDTQTRNADSLVRNLLAEGTATLVGNPMDFVGDGTYLQFLKNKHSRNMDRLEENFALFEALYYRAMRDPEAEFANLYNLGFSGNWDSPLYFVGFSIAQGLERHLGRGALVELLANGTGADVLSEYIRVYTENDDHELVKFTGSIEGLIRNDRDPDRPLE